MPASRQMRVLMLKSIAWLPTQKLVAIRNSRNGRDTKRSRRPIGA
jgi:hypothetical protein